MGTTCFTSSPCSSSILCKTRTAPAPTVLQRQSSVQFRYPSQSSSLSKTYSLSYLPQPIAPRKNSAVVYAVVDEEPLAATVSAGDAETEGGNTASGAVAVNTVRPSELYVCNIPRSIDIAELHELFKPYGTVQSVEVAKNAETGISRGCGYVTMSSYAEAKIAITALDGSDVGGREVRVRFSDDVDAKGRYLEKMSSGLKRNLIFESPHKIYVGNLAWAVTPEDLKNHFSQFGTVSSARVLQDRKGGKNRVYGFLSFTLPAERDASISLDGTEFFGRTIIVREVAKKTEA